MKESLLPSFLARLLGGQSSEEVYRSKRGGALLSGRGMEPGSGRARRIYLGRNEVVKLGEEALGRTLRVESGLVWLTETPANGDWVLGDGKERRISDRVPLVVQALEPAVVELC